MIFEPFYEYAETLSVSSNIFISVLVILFILCLILLAFCIYAEKAGLIFKNRRRMIKRLNPNRSYIFDFGRKTITIINLKNVEKKGIINFDEFDKLVHPNDLENLKKWLNLLFNKEITHQDKDSFFICHFIEKKHKNKDSYVESALYCKFINESENKIYIDRYSLYFLPFLSLYKKKNSKVSKHKYFYTLDELEQVYKKDVFRRGSEVLLKIKRIETIKPIYNDYLIRILTLNSIFKVLENNSCIYVNESDPTEIIIFGSKQMKRSELRSSYIKKIMNSIDLFFSVNGYSEYYTYEISFAQVNDFEINVGFSKNIELLRGNLENELPSLSKSRAKFFDPNQSDQQYIKEYNKKIIERIISNKDSQGIHVEFRSIYHLTAKGILKDYALFGKPVYNAGSDKYSIDETGGFKDYDELKAAATKIDLDKSLFSVVSKLMISSFLNGADELKKNNRLVYSINIRDINYIPTIYSRISRRDSIDTYFLLNDYELINMTANDKFKEKLQRLKQNYHLALRIAICKKAYTLDSETYSLFDMFVFDGEGIKEIKMGEQQYLIINKTLEKFVAYKKPMILINFESFEANNILIKFGMEYFSTNILTGWSQTRTIIDKRVKRKFENLKKE